METSQLKLTLVRDTSLQIPQGVCYGQSDIDVAVTFIQEAAITKEKIKHLALDAAFTSPLQRCVKLAHALDLKNVTHDERLKELHFGDWEMQAWNDVPSTYFGNGYRTMAIWHYLMVRRLGSCK